MISVNVKFESDKLVEQGFNESGVQKTSEGESGASLYGQPVPLVAPMLKKLHGAAAEACVSGDTGAEGEFIFADVFGGGMTKYSDADASSRKRRACKESGCSSWITTISLHDFLVQHSAPHTIDYLSVGTEGSEYEILSKSPFDRWDVRLLTVEHNYTDQREKIAEMLEGLGFVRIESQCDD